MIYNGYGVERDYAEAVSRFRLAATQGNADAQKMLIEAEDRMNNGPTNQAAAGYFTMGRQRLKFWRFREANLYPDRDVPLRK